jgi:predicted NAD/FAD-dependent oxidoreductase
MAAIRLGTAGLRVVVVDKGRSVGGRLATRRVAGGRADHGAQFFTVRRTLCPLGGRMASNWPGPPWSHGWSDGSLASTSPDGHPRYAVQGGMDTLARHLATQAAAAGVLLRTDKPRRHSPHPENAGWQFTAEEGTPLLARAAVLRRGAPEPCPARGVQLAVTRHAPTSNASATNPLCAASSWSKGVTSWNLARYSGRAPIAWIADNQRRGISPGATVVTLHAGGEWSAAHYDEPDERVEAAFSAGLAPWLAEDATVVEAQVKRWRYAAPTVLHPERLLRAEHRCTPALRRRQRSESPASKERRSPVWHSATHAGRRIHPCSSANACACSIIAELRIRPPATTQSWQSRQGRSGPAGQRSEIPAALRRWSEHESRSR